MTISSIPHIIPVLSGKGGVGKSSVTVQLALSLCLAGHSVGVLDIDLTGPSIPRLFGIEKEKIRQAPGGWLPVQVSPRFDAEEGQLDASNSALQTTNGGEPDGTRGFKRTVGSLHCMSLGFLLRDRGDAVVWRGPKKTAMVGQLLAEVLWPLEITHLLIDTPPGTSDEHISLMTNLLDPIKFPPPFPSPWNPSGSRHLAAVIVTTPQAISTADVKKELTFCRKVGLKVLGVVENMAGYVCPCCGEVTNIFSKGGGQAMAQDWGVQFLGSIPLDGEGWGMLVEEGKRPVYGSIQNANQPTEESTADGKRVPDPGTLVEKYTSCSLAPIFADVVKLLEGNEGSLPNMATTQVG